MNDLEKLYKIFGWIEDTESPEGRKRLENSIKKMSRIIAHHRLVELLEKNKRITILDICSGKGIGFISLAKAINQKYSVQLDIIAVDLRRTALDKASEYAERELGIRITKYVYDVTRLWELDLKADIVLLYGFSTPHFNPYDMVKISASVARIIGEEGVFLVEESDRIYNIYQRFGYKWILPEHVDEEKTILSIEAGRDTLKGVNRRLTIDLVSGERVLSEIRLWDIAGTASILWSFFKHVDIIPYASPSSGMIVAWGSRGIDPSQYSDYPEIISSRQ